MPICAPSSRRKITLRYPQQTDAAVNQALAQLKPRAGKQKKKKAAMKAAKAGAAPEAAADLGAPGAAANAEGSDGTVDIVTATEAAVNAANQKRRQVMAFLQAALSGSASAPVAGAGTTLLLAMDAPAAAVRALVSTL